jgi:hypothetical protein
MKRDCICVLDHPLTNLLLVLLLLPLHAFCLLLPPTPRWRMPKELAIDLSALALYDTIIYADDSGSMESYDGERIDDLKLIMSKVLI